MTSMTDLGCGNSDRSALLNKMKDTTSRMTQNNTNAEKKAFRLLLVKGSMSLKEIIVSYHFVYNKKDFSH